MLISLSGMASQLDTIAASEADQSRASDLHQTATSLQIAAWALSTLQQSVHGFYGAVSARQIMRCNAQIMQATTCITLLACCGENFSHFCHFLHHFISVLVCLLGNVALTMQNTFQSGICGQEKSSTAEILGSLSQAITGYVPIVTMLGNQVRVWD